MWGYVSSVNEISIDSQADDYATTLEVWKLTTIKISLGSIILSSIRLTLNWKNMILWKRYEITYLDCIHSLIFPNSINLRQIFMY